MTKLTINRNQKGICGNFQTMTDAAPQPDKKTTVYKVMQGNPKTQHKSAVGTPWRYMTKRQRKNRRRVNRLIELWPDLFSREAPKPLKVGIFDDLIQDITARGLAFGPGALRAAVASYAQAPRYYRALMAGGVRYDLTGQPCDEVTQEEQEAAHRQLEIISNRRKQAKNNGQKIQTDTRNKNR